MSEYVIKSTFCFLILYLGYVAFLRNSRNYHINRIVLLFSVFFALLVPTLNITASESQVFRLEPNEYSFKVLASQKYFLSSGPVHTVLESSSFDLSFVIWVIYACISLVLLVRFAFHIGVLLLKAYGSEKIAHKGNKLTLIDEKVNPFTFFTTIFICRAYYQSKNVEEELILHEIAHKKQLHSIDVLLIELVGVFFWFNPFVYLFKRRIKENHEYLADDFVLKSGICHRDYSYKLLNHTIKSKTMQLASGFNHLVIKNRLVMVSKFNQKRGFAYQLLLMVPIIILLFSTTAFKNADGAVSATKLDQQQGMFYADTLIWLGESKEIGLKGKMRVNFGESNFRGEGGYTGFDPVHLLLFNGQKVPANTPIAITGLKCKIVKLTQAEATKKYDLEGKFGAHEITTSR